jgi:hypothetical protein
MGGDPSGVTPLFSPRSGLSPLELYVELLDEANDLACITFAFTVPNLFKTALKTTPATDRCASCCWRRRTGPR